MIAVGWYRVRSWWRLCRRCKWRRLTRRTVIADWAGCCHPVDHPGGPVPVVDLMRPAPGWQRCCICFEARRVEDLYVDPSGVVWDLCPGDCARQAGHP